jgi:hypothetical protein
MKDQRGSKRYSYSLSLTWALDGGEWSAPRPCRFTTGTETLYPLYGRLGGFQGRSGLVRKISFSTGIRSPDRPARSESLYRLSHPGPRKATSSFVITQRPSVCMKQHVSCRMDYREVLYQALLLKSVDTFPIVSATGQKEDAS